MDDLRGTVPLVEAEAKDPAPPADPKPQRTRKVNGAVWGILITVGLVLLPLGAVTYNQFQANQLEERLGISDDDLLSEEEFREFAALRRELGVTDQQAALAMQEIATDMGRDPLSDAELVELREAVAEMDAFVLSAASCDAIDEWMNDRFVNALGIVDLEAVAMLGSARGVWGDADASIKFFGCFGPG